jgi:FdhD protein
MREVEIVKIDLSSKKARKKRDFVAEEKPLHVFLNKAHYATFYCSPSNLTELAVGHLLSDGVIKSKQEIQQMTLKEEACRIKLGANVNLESRLKPSMSFSRVILSPCGSPSPYQYSGRLPKIKSNVKVKAEVILDCVKSLNFIAETFRKTGGVHVAAIFKIGGNLVAFAEDVGRHNAVDKAIGMGALNRNSFSMCFLALSGRLTGDIVVKAARVGLPLVASRAAAIDSGISVAERSGITLVGFARGNHMNAYTFHQRIIQAN